MNLIEKLRMELPVIWERAATDKLLGGVCKGRTLNNLKVKGKGPKCYCSKSGRKVIFERDSFLEWFEKEVVDLEEKHHE